MATINSANFAGPGVGGLHPARSTNVKVPYLTETVLDFADAATAKGSALASADVIQVVNVAPDTAVLYAGVAVVEEMTGTSTDATIDVTLASTDFVSAFDLDAAAEGDIATSVDAVINTGTADTIDVVLGTFTGTITGGKVRVFALMVDLTEAERPGRAKLGS